MDGTLFAKVCYYAKLACYLLIYQSKQMVGQIYGWIAWRSHPFCLYLQRRISARLTRAHANRRTNQTPKHLLEANWFLLLIMVSMLLALFAKFIGWENLKPELFWFERAIIIGCGKSNFSHLMLGFGWPKARQSTLSSWFRLTAISCGGSLLHLSLTVVKMSSILDEPANRASDSECFEGWEKSHKSCWLLANNGVQFQFRKFRFRRRINVIILIDDL